MSLAKNKIIGLFGTFKKKIVLKHDFCIFEKLFILSKLYFMCSPCFKKNNNNNKSLFDFYF